jgi:hypothetical protein
VGIIYRLKKGDKILRWDLEDADEKYSEIFLLFYESWQMGGLFFVGLSNLWGSFECFFIIRASS